MTEQAETEQEEIFRLRTENAALRQMISRNANTLFLAGRQPRRDGDHLQRDYFDREPAYAIDKTGHL